MIPETAHKVVVASLSALLLLYIGYLATATWGALPEPRLTTLLPSIATELSRPAAQIPWAIAASLALWIHWLARRLKENPLDRSVRIRERYEQCPKSGAMVHRKTQKHFCHRCLLKEPPIEAQLHCPGLSDCQYCPSCQLSYVTPQAVDDLLASPERPLKKVPR